MNNKTRQIIFDKLDGHCAYCGAEIESPAGKHMHVDHLLPVVRNNDGTYMHPERLHIDNQVPSCPSCNQNKHSYTLEEFRSLITGFMKHLNEVNTQYKVAKRYGLVKEDIKPIVFYFERFN